ncbi:heat shock protein HspQ [Algiphilus sp.]|uniref:heat shock protein HspQ n=2 Tax=Algiphilus sp. TaxID=1872431 RepID=UPI0032EAC8AB
MMAQPRFAIGEIVHHLKFDYRGVIIDVDAQYNGSEAWYEQVARSRPPKDAPWYHVLVDGAMHSTYVAERHLEAGDSSQQIEHPALGQFFDRFSSGRYHRRGMN